MATAIAQLHTWEQEFAELPLTHVLQSLSPDYASLVSAPSEPVPLRLWSEVRNLMAIAQLILTSAHYRTESRGGHYRNDFPTPDPQWQVHTLVQGDRWSTAPIQPPPEC